MERVFTMLKYGAFEHPRFLLRRRGGPQTEISPATLAYNLIRMQTVLGSARLRTAQARWSASNVVPSCII